MSEQGFYLLVHNAATEFPFARALARPETFDYWGLVAIAALAFAVLALRLGTALNRRTWRDQLFDQKREMRRRARESLRSVSESANGPNDLGDTAADRSCPLVLVVRAETGVRSICRSLLPSSYRIVEAGSTDDALQIARLLSPELVILDGTRSTVTAIACCRMIKTSPDLRHIPTLLCATSIAYQSRLEAVQSGVDVILTAPIAREEILAQVDNLIVSRRLLRERYRGEVLLKPFDVVIPSSEHTFIEKVYDVINRHLDDGSLTVGRLAREVGVSETQLKRKLRSLINESPVELIRRIRLEHAGELLRNQAGNVGDVAFATGFTNLSYFAKCFRNHWGVNPSQFLETERPGRAASEAC